MRLFSGCSWASTRVKTANPEIFARIEFLDLLDQLISFVESRHGQQGARHWGAWGRRWHLQTRPGTNVATVSQEAVRRCEDGPVPTVSFSADPTARGLLRFELRAERHKFRQETGSSTVALRECLSLR